MKPVRIINHKTRLHDIRFIQLANDRECLLVAAEDKSIAVYDLEGSEVADESAIWAKFVGHANRCVFLSDTSDSNNMCAE
jgi:hypothetical protein